MPNRDGTGPNGLGPMTGGGFGLCVSGNRLLRKNRRIGLGIKRRQRRRFGNNNSR